MEGRKEGGGIAIVQIPKFKKFCSSIAPVLTRFITLGTEIRLAVVVVFNQFDQ